MSRGKRRGFQRALGFREGGSERRKGRGGKRKGEGNGEGGTLERESERKEN